MRRHATGSGAPAAGQFRRRLPIFLALLILAAGVNPLAAETNSAGATPYFAKNWGTREGLAERSILSLLRARDGYLWAGTWNGLSRFDGIQFRSFTPNRNPGMSAETITALFEDPDGTLWIGGEGSLMSFQAGRFEAATADGGFPDGQVSTIIRDREGNLWAAFDQVLFRGKNGRFQQVAAAGKGMPNWVRGLVLDESGTLWLAGYKGLWRWQGDAFQVEPDFAQQGVRSIAPGKDNVLWLGLDPGGIAQYAKGVLKPVPGTERYIAECLYVANNGDVWAGVGESTLMRLREGRIQILDRSSGLSGALITEITEDEEGNIWAGTDVGGLFQLREQRILTIGRANNVPVEDLSSLAATSDGEILFGTFQNGLLKWNGSRAEPATEPRGEPGAEIPEQFRSIWTVGAGPNSAVLLGTWAKTLGRTPEGRFVFLTNSASERARNFLWDRGGGLWIACESFLEHRTTNGVNWHTPTNGLLAAKFRVLAEDRDGAIWAGSGKGLCRIRGRQVDVFQQKHGLGSDDIRALLVDSKGTLWAGTLHGGLSAWRPDQNRFVTLSKREGLVDDSIVQILQDNQGDFWLGTNRGLMRLRQADVYDWLAGKHPSVHGAVLAEEEGLPQADCGTGHQPSAMRAADGRLWFCTGSGIAVIDPGRIRGNTKPPPVYIEAVTVDGKLTEFFSRRGGNAGGQAIPAAPEVTIPPGTRQITISYCAIDLDAPSRVRYRTRLTGQAEDWEEAGANRQAVFHFLAPRRYEFQVLASNGNGVWSATGTSVWLNVQPHFWQTATFNSAIVLLLAAAAWGWYRQRMGRLEKLRSAQETFSRQLIATQEAERKRVAGELHDSLGQNLLVVKNLALLGVATNGAKPETAAQFTEISQAATVALTEVRSISRSLRPAELDRLGITQALGAMLDRLADSSTIHYEVDLQTIDGSLPSEFEIGLYRVVQEATNNIVKHSGATTARVSLRKLATGIQLRLEDDGQGLDRAAVSARPGFAGMGLSGMEERVRMMGGQMTISSQSGHGTTLTFTIPLPSNPGLAPD